MRRVAAIVVVSLVLVATIAGCGAGDTARAKFIRYSQFQNGTRVAIISRIDPGFPSEEPVSVGLDDLRTGEIVLVRDVGRSWDQPQWQPSAEVVARADGR